VASGDRRALVPLLALLWGATPVAARADQPTARARLVYLVDPAAQPCPPPEELRAAIEARVGHAVFGEPATLTVDVNVRRDGAVFIATVALPDAPGERGASRELRSDVGCAELVSATALVASIALDPASALRPPPPVAEPPRASPPRTWRAQVGLGPRAAWGFTPDPLAGVAVSGAAVSEHAAFGAALEGFASGDATFGGAGDVRIRPMALALLPCRLGAHWEACGVARLGLLRGAGTGFDTDLTTWKAFMGLGGRAGAFVDLGRLRLRASLEAAYVVPRTAFVVGDATVYTTRSVSVAAGLDALVAFQ
jgi:hypothetical protein